MNSAELLGKKFIPDVMKILCGDTMVKEKKVEEFNPFGMIDMSVTLSVFVLGVVISLLGFESEFCYHKFITWGVMVSSQYLNHQARKGANMINRRNLYPILAAKNDINETY